MCDAPRGVISRQWKKLSLIQHIATQAFASLSRELQELSYIAFEDDSSLAENLVCIINRPSTRGNAINNPVGLGPCLKYYSIICEEKDLKGFFLNIICKYIQECKVPRNCELCERSRQALTAHHLVPRSVLVKARKQAWHEEKTLTKVAWLCRSCHGFVHRIASPKALGKDHWSIELLLRRTEIWQFAKAIGRLVK